MVDERQLPGLGLYGFWREGSNGWKDQMDRNFRRLSALVQLTVISRTTALPSSPETNAVYIVPADAAENANKVGVFDNGEWVFFTPATGLRATVRDEEAFYWFDGTAWTEEQSGGLSAIDVVFDSEIFQTDAIEFSGGGVSVSQGEDGTVTVTIGGGGSGGIEEAPVDGKQYARKDAGWVEVQVGSGGDSGIPDAPSDGEIYGRKDGGWVPVSSGEVEEVGEHTYWRVRWTANADAVYAGLTELIFNGSAPTGGTPVFSSQFATNGNNSAAGAFDSDDTTQWVTTDNQVANAWLGYQFSAPVSISEVAIRSGNTDARAAYSPLAFVVEYSDDGVTWTEVEAFIPATWTALLTQTFEVPTTIGVVPVEEAPLDGQFYVRKDGEWVTMPAGGGGPDDPEVGHLYWRIYITDHNSDGVWTDELQFRSQLGVDEPHVGGTPFASSGHNANYPPQNAFSTSGGALDTSDPPMWLGYQFPEPHTVEQLYYRAYASSDRWPSIFAVEFSDDGETWTLAWAINGADFTTVREQTFNAPWAKNVPDMPEIMDGDAGKVLTVKSDETGAEWKTAAAGGGGVVPSYRMWRFFIHTSGQLAENEEAGFVAAVGMEMRDENGVDLVGSGTPIASSSNSETVAPSFAFDPWTAETANYWTNANDGTPAWIGYDFGAPTEVHTITLTGVRAPERMPSNFDIQASNDGENWRTLAVISGETDWVVDGTDTREYQTIPDATAVLPEAPLDNRPYLRKQADWFALPTLEDGTKKASKFWRLYFPGSSNSNWLGLSDLDFLDALGNEYQLDGTATVSSIYDTGYGPEGMFDSSDSTGWLTATGQQAGSWVAYEFPEPHNISAIRVHAIIADTTYSPTGITVQVSEDGVTWEDLYEYAPLDWETNLDQTILLPAAGSSIPEPPEDGKPYVRMNGAWVLLERDAVMSAFAGGALVGSEIIVFHLAAEPFTLPVGLAGSFAQCLQAPTAEATFSVRVDDVEVGTVVFAAGETEATFTAASETEVAAGSSVKVSGPDTADATLAGVSITIKGVM